MNTLLLLVVLGQTPGVHFTAPNMNTEAAPGYVVGRVTPPDSPLVKERYRAINAKRRAAVEAKAVIAAAEHAVLVAQRKRFAKMPLAERADRVKAGEERP